MRASRFAAAATRPGLGPLTATWISGVCPSRATLPSTGVAETFRRRVDGDSPTLLATRRTTDSERTIERAVDGFVFGDWTRLPPRIPSGWPRYTTACARYTWPPPSESR